MDVMKLGEVLAQSGFFTDSRGAAQAVVKVLAGQELGFGPVASMTGINIIKGRVTLSANLLAAAVKRSGKYSYRIIEHTDKACEIEFTENGEVIGRSRFTMEDAKNAQLNGDNWKKFPANMLFARAISNGAKWHCPDIFGGPIYTPDELGAAVDEEGDVIDATPRIVDNDTGEVQTAAPAPTPDSEAQPTTRGERSTHNPPKPSVADELPPAAQEQVDAYDATTDKRPLSQTTLPQLQQWIMGKYPNVTNISHASNTIIKALQEEGKLRADAGWAAVFGNGFVVAAVAEAVDRYESAEGNAPAAQPQLVEVPVPADTPQKRWKAG